MGNRIIISESQYSRVFLNEQKDYNDDLLYYINPVYKDFEGKSVKQMFGDWTGSLSDLRNRLTGEFMPHLQNSKLTSMGGKIPLFRETMDYNETLRHWNKVRSPYGWKGSKIIMVDGKWLEKNGKNAFNIIGGSSNMYGEGAKCNIFSPQWLIERYLQISNIIELGMDDFANYDKAFYKAKKREEEVDYYKKLKVFYEKRKNWEDKYGGINKKIWDSLKISVYQKPPEHIEIADNNSKDKYTPIDRFEDLAPIDNYNISKTEKEENREKDKYVLTKEFIADMFGVNLDILRDDLTLSNTVTDKRVDQIKIFQDWLDKYYPNWISPPLNKKIESGYGKFGPKTKIAWKKRGGEFADLWKLSKIPERPLKPIKPVILSSTGDEYEYKSDMEKQKEDIKDLVGGITERNNILNTQKLVFNKSNSYTKGVSTVQKYCTPHHISTTKDDNYAFGERKNYSPNYYNLCDTNGVWIYQSDIKTTVGCGCVSPQQGTYIDNDGGGSFDHITWKETRGPLKVFDDWAATCVEDGHCIADIASIAVLFIPGIGIALSGIIDAISAGVYVYQKKEGWKINAILTGLGAFGAGTEVLRVFRKANKVKEITLSMANAGKELKKLEGTLNYKNLSKGGQAAERGKILQDSLKGLSSGDITDLKNMIHSVQNLNKTGDFAKFLEGMDTLNDLEKSELQNIVKNFDKNPNNKKIFVDGLKESNYDIKLFLKTKTAKILRRQAILQASLFTLIMAYPEATAKLILGGLKSMEDLTYKISGKKFPITKYLVGMVDENQKDVESEELREVLMKMVDYESVANEILRITNDTLKEITEKYKGFDVKKIKEKVFDGDDPVIGAPLKEIRDKLSEVYVEINKLMDSGSSDIDIEKKLSSYYTTLITMIDKDIQSEKDMDAIIVANKSNPKNGYTVLPNMDGIDLWGEDE